MCNVDNLSPGTNVSLQTNYFFCCFFHPLFSLYSFQPVTVQRYFFQILSIVFIYLLTNSVPSFLNFFCMLLLIICVDSPWISIQNESETFRSAVTCTKSVKKWLFSRLLVLHDGVGGFFSPARCHCHYFLEADTSLIIH